MEIENLNESNEDVCKGLVFKSSIGNYIDKSGNIVRTVRMHLMKRMSCSGCEKCIGIREELNENNKDIIPNNVEHGKLYKLSIDILSESYDGETSYCLVLKEIEE